MPIYADWYTATVKKLMNVADTVWPEVGRERYDFSETAMRQNLIEKMQKEGDLLNLPRVIFELDDTVSCDDMALDGYTFYQPLRVWYIASLQSVRNTSGADIGVPLRAYIHDKVEQFGRYVATNDMQVFRAVTMHGVDSSGSNMFNVRFVRLEADIWAANVYWSPGILVGYAGLPAAGAPF